MPNPLAYLFILVSPVSQAIGNVLAAKNCVNVQSARRGLGRRAPPDPPLNGEAKVDFAGENLPCKDYASFAEFPFNATDPILDDFGNSCGIELSSGSNSDDFESRHLGGFEQLAGNLNRRAFADVDQRSA